MFKLYYTYIIAIYRIVFELFFLFFRICYIIVFKYKAKRQKIYIYVYYYTIISYPLEN